VAYNPPIISVSFRLFPSQPKDTRDNILATKQFVVNLISEPFIEAANETSVVAPADVSEWDISGLTQEPSVSDRA
jgi:flavin reductase (DIM6/NTAB) family NADH-FMN oxidoreductase RutF